MGTLHIIQNKEPSPVKACSTCRHFTRARDPEYSMCLAASTYADHARTGECCGGAMWEPIPPPKGILIKIKEWLIG